MAVATKKIDTKVLSNSIKENFESVRDGTGKALSKFEEGLDSLFSTIDNLIDTALKAVGKVVNTVMSVIDKVLQTVNKVVNKVMSIVGKIIKGIAGIIRTAISGIMNILKIPLQFLGRIFNKVMGFVKRLLQPFGALLPSKAWLKRNFNKVRDFFNTETGNIVKTSMLAGIIGGIEHSDSNLANILKVLSRNGNESDVLKAYRLSVSDGTSYNSNYYRRYYGLLNSGADDGFKGGIPFRAYRYLNGMSYMEMAYLNNTIIKDEKTLDRVFNTVGYNKANINNVINFAINGAINDCFNNSGYNIDTIKTFKDLRSQPIRKKLSFSETVNVINQASSLIRPNLKVYEDTKDEKCILERYKQKNRTDEYIRRRYPNMINNTYVNTDNIFKPTSTFYNKTSSIRPDYNNKLETERIRSTNGVLGHKVTSSPTKVAFDKFVHKTIVKEAKKFARRENLNKILNIHI